MGELTGDLVSNTFAGAPFQQTWNDLPIWEHFLNRFPCRSIVDIGTGVGGMALFLAVQAFTRDMRHTTIDKNRICDDRVVRLLHDLGTSDRLLHAFKDVDAISRIIVEQPRPLVLFCDNGDKPREVELYAPSLRPGDFLAVHDWGAEIGEAHIPNGYRMVLRAECESTDSVTRFFARE